MKKLEKLDRLPPYVFAEVNRIKDDARSKGKDIIDFGMGNPDSPTPKHIVDKLIEAVQDPKSHRYSSSKGISGLRKAQAEYYERRFNVKLNFETEVVATLGSKEGLANMAQVLSIPSDTFLVPNPAYPIHAFGFIISIVSCYCGLFSDKGAFGVGTATTNAVVISSILILSSNYFLKEL